MTVYACCQRNRVTHALAHPSINGIHFIEVLDFEGQAPAERQRRLVVHFIRPINPALAKENFVVEGGERVTNIEVTDVAPTSSNKVITLSVDQAGDFSIYNLRLVVDRDNDLSVPVGYDPRLANIEFSFKINCLNGFDCVDDVLKLEASFEEPDISYLAKDYNSFVQLMLDRMAVTIPEWKERNPSDFGMMMIEMFAYVGDQLSAFQDAVGTEAYLATARSRISVRRHCRLVDYFMHDGCNARTWVFVQAGAPVDVPAGTKLLTYVPSVPASLTADTLSNYQIAVSDAPIVFETMHEVAISPEHNEMPFYTWGDDECCLSPGTTQATLLGHYNDLSVGDFILLEEVRGAKTGKPQDADPSKRHVVRLTRITPTEDPVGGVFTAGFSANTPVPVTDIEWDPLDALPFSLCISSPAAEGDISVSRGNIVLADHGATITKTAIPSLDQPDIFLAAGEAPIIG
jgi:hypothetical protein